MQFAAAGRYRPHPVSSSSRRRTLASSASASAQQPAISPAMTSLSAAALDRLRGCLWGIMVGDALSMPVHWYYDPNVLQVHGRSVHMHAWWLCARLLYALWLCAGPGGNVTVPESQLCPFCLTLLLLLLVPASLPLPT